MEKIKIAIVDDHELFSKALELMIAHNPGFEVIINCINGEEFLDQLWHSKLFPDVVLMDINMPIKNGVETTQEITRFFPSIKVIALTGDDHEFSIIRMLKAGAKGYLLKASSPELLFEAMKIVHEKGVFHTELLTQILLKIRNEEKFINEMGHELNDRERTFIKLACSELTYKEIANQMCLSPRTIDGYRDSVFIKLNVKSRVGIVLFALKHHLL